MGQSTNAILFYGYCWDSEDAIDDDLRNTAGLKECADIPEWPEIIARKRGHANPWDNYEDRDGETYAEQRKRGDAWCVTNRQRINTWNKIRKDIQTEFGVKLDSHCSGDHQMPMLAVWSMVATRGNPKQAALPVPYADWTTKLDQWLAELGIEAPQDSPRYWLVSDWH